MADQVWCCAAVNWRCTRPRGERALPIWPRRWRDRREQPPLHRCLGGQGPQDRGAQPAAIGLVCVVLGFWLWWCWALGLGPDRSPGPCGEAAILWVAYLFSGILCFEKTMAAERQDEAMSALLMAPIDRGVMFLAKLAANLVLMLGLALVITPVGMVLFGFDLSAAPGAFAGILFLSLVGFAAIGTLLSAAASAARRQGGLLAILVFPLVLPLVIASTQLMLGLSGTARSGGGGMGILIAFDAVFLVASWLTFELVIEP